MQNDLQLSFPAASLAPKPPKLLLSGRHAGITFVIFTKYPKYMPFSLKSVVGTGLEWVRFIRRRHQIYARVWITERKET